MVPEHGADAVRMPMPGYIRADEGEKFMGRKIYGKR